MLLRLSFARLPKRLFSYLLAAGIFLITGNALADEQMTLLIPSQPNIEEKNVSADQPRNEQVPAGKEQAKKTDRQTKSRPEGKPVPAPEENGKDKTASASSTEIPQGTEKTSRKKSDANATMAPVAVPEKVSREDSQEKKNTGKDAQPSSEKPEAATKDNVNSKLADTVTAVNASVIASGSPENINEEVDLLIAGMDLFQHRGIAMDMPRIFTIYRFDKDVRNPSVPAQREDLLGDIEEIRYLDQKAWGTNVGISRPGLYQFSIETRPWWNSSTGGYEQQLVKTMLPVYGAVWGWHLPVGLTFEIIPLTRPFGLTAPVLFSGKVLVEGKPATDISVELQRINTDNSKVPTHLHEKFVTRTQENGSFSAVLAQPGWWCCRAMREGAPLKGPDGNPSPLRISTLFWFFVDSPQAAIKK